MMLTKEGRELFKICRNTLKGSSLWDVVFPIPKTGFEKKELKQIWERIDAAN